MATAPGYPSGVPLPGTNASTATPRRLPGIAFTLQPPPLSDVLPRMDVAVFVGFATSGPLDTPVAVEDVVQFTAIFGDDVLLAWDTQQGKPVYAYLAPTVRAFFRNGGKRCWVIRVAGKGIAFNYFPVPGLLRVKLGDDGNVADMAPAFARACSRGSWSDGLRVGASLSVQPLVVMEEGAMNRAPASDKPVVTIMASSTGDVMVGDLLRLTYGQNEEYIQLVVVDEVIVLSAGVGRSVVGRRDEARPYGRPSQQNVTLQLSCRRILWFSTRVLNSLDSQPPVLQMGYIFSHSVDDVTAQIQLSDAIKILERSLNAAFSQLEAAIPAFASLVDIAMPSQLEMQVQNTFRAVSILSSDVSDNQNISLVLDVSYNDAPEPGTIIYVNAEPASLWLTIREVEEIHLPGQNIEQRVKDRRVQVTGEGYWVLAGIPSPLPDQFVRMEQLSFSLYMQQGGSSNLQLQQDALTFDMRHPRCWNALPTDQQLYGDPDMNADVVHQDLWQGATEPRFLLSGSYGNDELYIPIGMPQFLLDHFLGVDQEGAMNRAPTLERDGLGQFTAAMFLDSDIVNAPVVDVMNQADFLQYQYDFVRPLKGIHAALNVDEATIIAVPDAVHLGWHKSTDDTSPPEGRGAMNRAQMEGFTDCLLRADPPILSVAQYLSANGFILSWSAADNTSGMSGLSSPVSPVSPVEANAYVLEESLSPDFKKAVSVYMGPEQSVTLYGRDLGVYYYRVQQVSPVLSDWSQSLTVRVGNVQQWQLDDVQSYDPSHLIAVQRALLRMCAARGDLFAVLSLPGHYAPDALEVYVRKLKAQADTPVLAQDVANFPPPGGGGDGDPALPFDFPLGFAERKALTFGALYHPWLVCREETGKNIVSTIPPDGAICGMIAQSSIVNGAWIAPANQLLTGVVALTPQISQLYYERMMYAQVNLIRQNVGHTLVFSQDTLCDDDDADLRPINVRRLLMLIRRLVLLLGPTYVFEPNSEVFRRSVARGFETMFNDMYMRGAFAGDSPATSFQVVCDSTVNKPESVEVGNFIVELRVAPSLPMTFMTIRLVQSATGALVVET